MPAFMCRCEIWKLIKSFENKQKIAHRSMERAMIVVKRKKRSTCVSERTEILDITEDD